MSTRTKMLMSVSALPALAVVAVVVGFALPYYQEMVSGHTSTFIIFHFHLLGVAALLILWVIVLIATLISFRHDKKRRSTTNG